MVGIVVVSHSEPLARSAVDLALQMVGSEPPPIEIAAGHDGGLGTDAVAVSEAIRRADEASAGSGVLVISDLGSAVLSSEMALEFVDDLSGEVLLSRAPFVEGLVAAVVQAGIGRSLAQVEAEAVRAAATKAEHLGPSPVVESESPVSAKSSADAEPDAVVRDVELVNPQGLHARPAALLVAKAAALPAEVSIVNVTTGAGPAAADSTLELMTLGAKHGHVVRLSASGDGAEDSVETLVGLIVEGLGEGIA